MQIRNQINAAIGYLERSQLPSGQFRVQMMNFANDPERRTVEEDEALFATAHIAYSLGFVPENGAKAMIGKSLEYFKQQMTGHGLWRHWNKSARRGGISLYSFIPADLDDMASICYLLQKHGISFPDNRCLFFGNRNRLGLYYTWLMARPTLSFSLVYWWSMLREFRPQRFTIFFSTTEASYLDVDGVVNANVALYLGNCPQTVPVLNWIEQIVEQGLEAECDKWYRDRYTFYYAVSRVQLEGVSLTEGLKLRAISRICEDTNPTGCIGSNILQTALAVCALMSFGCKKIVVSAAIQAIMDAQQPDGSWASETYYYGGPQLSARWGSSELTTGICLEALARYQSI